MARLPTADDIQRQAPQPNRTVAGYRTGMEEQASGEMGTTLVQLADREIERLDTLKLTEAETALMQAEMELETEYKQYKNGDVLKPDFHEGFKDRYRRKVEEITGGLSTAAQKQKFGQVAGRRGVGYDAQRITYAMGEAERYETAVFQGRLETLVQKGAASYRDPVALSSTTMELENTFAQEMVRKGISDPAILTAELAKLRSGYWSSVLDRALVDDDTVSAKNLYAASRGLLLDDQKKRFDDRFKSLDVMTGGADIAEKAYEMMRSGASAAEVEMYIARSAGTNQQMYNAAQTVLTNIRQREDIAEKESYGQLLLDFAASGGSASAMRKVMSSDGFASMKPEQQGRLAEHMRNEAMQTQRFNLSMAQEARAREAERYDNPDVFGEMLDIMENPRFAEMSRRELEAYRTKIGPKNLTALLRAQSEQIKEGKRFKIDEDLIREAVPAKLLESKNKHLYYSYRGLAEARLQEWKDQHPGKTPSLIEQREIARAGLEEFNYKGWFGLVDSTKPMYAVTPEDVERKEQRDTAEKLKAEAQAKALAERDKAEKAERQQFEREIRAEARKRGAVLTKDQLDAAWQEHRQTKTLTNDPREMVWGL